MQSMTGFGRAENTTDTLQVKVEIHSVNRKQGEVLVQMPRSLIELESDIKKFVLSKVQRGRLQISITIESINSNNSAIQLNLEKAKALVKVMEQIEKASGKSLSLTASDFLRSDDIIHFGEDNISTEDAKAAIQPALDSALEHCIAMRLNEGVHMREDITSRIAFLEDETTSIEAHAPSVAEHHKVNLHRRLNESGVDIDLADERLLKEIGIFAERCDITEEITRLRSHFTKFREYLSSSAPVGRSLDFLCQEINREFNTIGSKANDATLAQHVVLCKTELEKAREQVQNVE